MVGIEGVSGLEPCPAILPAGPRSTSTQRGANSKTDIGGVGQWRPWTVDRDETSVSVQSANTDSVATAISLSSVHAKATSAASDVAFTMTLRVDDQL